MASLAFAQFKLGILKALIPDLSSGAVTVKCMLVNAAYAALADATKQGHTFLSDVSANEITGTGYTAGGLALTTKTVTLDGSYQAIADAADPSWAASTITASGAIIYIDTGVATTSRLIRYIDFGGAKASSAGTFTVQLAANGYLYAA